MLILLTHALTLAQLVKPSKTGSVTSPPPRHPAYGADKEENEEDGEILIKVKAGTANAIFDEASYIDYKVDLKSTYRLKQEGKFSYTVSTDEGKQLFEDSVHIALGRRGSKTVKFKLPPNPPGFYQLSIRMNLTAYDDTIKKVFGIAPFKITAPQHRPADFDAFWKKSRQMLDKIQPDYKVTEQKNLSTPEIKVYLVEMRSWGNALIRGWLTIPVKKDKFIPIRYRVPGYLVEMKPSMIEDDFAVFQLNVRGNGNSKDAINTFGIQYNNYHLESKDNYIYRAVYMDCLRGVDFLASHGYLGMDVNRIAIDGGSQGGCLAVITAALDQRIKGVTTEVPLYSDLREASVITMKVPPKNETPVWHLNNFVKRRGRSASMEEMYRVWDYYDPMHFAPDVQCPVLMGIGLMDELCPPRCSVAMFNQLGTSQKELWVSADKAHEVDPIYYRHQYSWLREFFLLP